MHVRLQEGFIFIDDGMYIFWVLEGDNGRGGGEGEFDIGVSIIDFDVSICRQGARSGDEYSAGVLVNDFAIGAAAFTEEEGFSIEGQNQLAEWTGVLIGH